MTDRLRRYVPIYLRACRGVVLYLCFLLLWLLASLCVSDGLLRGGEVTNDHFLLRLPYLVRSALVPFFFFSVARVFAENDLLTLQLGTKERQPLRKIAVRVLHSPFYWLELGAVLLLSVLLPFECGYIHLATALVGGRGWGRLQTKLLVLAIVLPSLALLHFWARLSAIQRQDDALRASGGAPKTGEGFSEVEYLIVASHQLYTPYLTKVPQGNQAEFETFNRRFGTKKSRTLRLVRQLAMIFPLYMVGMFGLSIFFPILLSFVFVLVALRYVQWWLPPALILGVPLAFWLYHFLRALRIRRRFVKRLQKVCREYGFACTKIKSPYRSLVRLGAEINFTLSANGKTYDCKLFAGLRRNCPLLFSEQGVVYCQHSFRIRRVEFFRYTTSYRFDFESPNTKVCIVAPVPKVIGAGNDQWNRPIDTGMAVGEYRIFSSTGFLGAITRDCVERD